MKQKKNLAKNRKLSFEYHIHDTYEAGIILTGSEVKSIRSGKISIEDSYARNKGNELYLYNCNISRYNEASYLNHEPTRPRKLLLKSREIKKIVGKITIKGFTLAVESVYLNERNIVKILISLVSGKKLHDKRKAIKEREWNRQKSRILKNSIFG